MRFVVATTEFDASHVDLDESPHRHGHHYIVEVWENTEIRSSILEDLEAVRDELHLRDLDEMLNGGASTGPGLASWFMERLLINHPKITRVEVAWGWGLRYGVSREVR